MTRRQIAESFRVQADWCRTLGSPLYGDLIDTAGVDVERGGPVFGVARHFDNDPDPMAGYLVLRLMGAVHRLVLAGLAPELASHYPSVGGTPQRDTLGADFVGTVSDHRGYLVDALSVAPQTNEVGRCAALLAGLAVGIGRHRRPMRLLELGASGGLNLLLDRYRYDLGSRGWGDAASPVAIKTAWTGLHPELPESFDIVERRGCDVAPIDLSNEESRLRLLSFVWPDQESRFSRLKAALELAVDDPPVVDAADAADWLGEMLPGSESFDGVTVVQHSVMWMYLSESQCSRITDLLASAGRRATERSPLVHVAFEPGPSTESGKGMDLSVTVWPGGSEHRMAAGHPHGEWIEWLA